MTTVLNDPAPQAALARTTAPREVRVALLGLGQVGTAIAEIAASHPDPGCRLAITSTLVRDLRRPRRLDVAGFGLTSDPFQALASNPDVVIEVLGGLEPARTLVLAALEARLPVVTANKSLLAVHGDELFCAAHRAGVPLLYEASVLAGVPFLDTFRRRPLARSVSAVQGIVNGTSNFILSRMARDRVDFTTALSGAQRAGYAEPDPCKDLDGDDAVEKLCVLLRHFGDYSVAPSQIAQRGIRDVGGPDLQHAAAFDGAIRPIAAAAWRDAHVTAYAGPAFVAGTHQLCQVDGVQNAVSLTTGRGDGLFFSGPGAGPAVTAATVLDDAVEAIGPHPERPTHQPRPCTVSAPSEGAWFVRLTRLRPGSGGQASSALAEQEAPALLTSLGVRLRRVSHIDARAGRHHQWLLTEPCARGHVAAALEVLEARTGIGNWTIPCVE